jgi:hypothetical protein
MAYKRAPSLDAGAGYRPPELLVDERPPVEHRDLDREATDRVPLEQDRPRQTPPPGNTKRRRRNRPSGAAGELTDELYALAAGAPLTGT